MEDLWNRTVRIIINNIILIISKIQYIPKQPCKRRLINLPKHKKIPKNAHPKTPVKK